MNVLYCGREMHSLDRRRCSTRVIAAAPTENGIATASKCRRSPLTIVVTICVAQPFIGSDFRGATTPPLLPRPGRSPWFGVTPHRAQVICSGALGCVRISTVLAPTLTDVPLNLQPRRVRSCGRVSLAGRFGYVPAVSFLICHFSVFGE